jgi:hypothetical protein
MVAEVALHPNAWANGWFLLIVARTANDAGRQCGCGGCLRRWRFILPNEDGATLVATLVSAEDACFFKLIDEATGTAVADTQFALEQADRAAATAPDNFHSFVKEFIARILHLHLINFSKERRLGGNLLIERLRHG